MKKINAEVIAGLFILLFAIFFMIEATNYRFISRAGDLGPGFFPTWLSGILIVLSLIYIYVAYQGKSVIEKFLPEPKAIKKISFILASMIIFLLAFNYAGFIICSLVFLFVLLYGSYKWYVSLGISAGVTASLYWLFQITLGVQLPKSFLGF